MDDENEIIDNEIIENIEFQITPDQAKKICEYFGVEYDDINDYEICEYLDKIIDEL